jgi:hypothetical protein
MEEWIKNKNWDSIEKHFRAVLGDRAGDDLLSGVRSVFEEQ